MLRYRQVSFTWSLKNDNDSLTDEKIWQRGQQSFLRLHTAVDLYRTYLCVANNSVGFSRACEHDVMGMYTPYKYNKYNYSYMHKMTILSSW